MRFSAALERGLIIHLKGTGYLMDSESKTQMLKKEEAYDNSPVVTSGSSLTGLP